LFRELGIPTPPFFSVDSLSDLRSAIEEIGLPAVLKTRRLGYDGKGQRVLRDEASIDAAWRSLGGSQLIVEQFVPFHHALSVIGVRARSGGCGRASSPVWEMATREEKRKTRDT